VSATNPGDLVDGRYKVVSRLGAGGMADVFLAEDQQLGREVALKLLHRRFAEDPGFVERFRREAQAAASLQHPNVVSVFDRGAFDGTYYIAMEYLSGRTLKALIRQEAPLDPVRAIDLTIQILKAARFAHRRGVVHRDLKPHNVIVDENDHAKVTDFGIARAGASDMTETGSIMGTAQYLSPEQAQGHAVSESSDLYSVGVILYELLTGRVPFDADSAVTIALKHVSEPPIPPSVINPAVPAPLEQAVLWALNKDPADRPADADQFITVLEQVREAIVSGATGNVTASMPIVSAATGATMALSRVPPTPSPTALVPYGATLPPALVEPPLTTSYNGAGGDERRRRNLWPWLLGLLILLMLAGGGVAAYLLTRPPAKATVPDLVYLQLSQAQAFVQNDGFNPDVVYEFSNEPTDEVIDQSPLAGARISQGSTITLTVSQGPGDANVPSVVELSQAAATRAIIKAGLQVGRVLSQTSGVVRGGDVIGTSPAAGAPLTKGTSVTLYVSSGKAPQNVPPVTGYTETAAKSALTGVGFKVSVTRQPSSTVAAGDVINQAPSGGVNAPYGSTVTITVATAPTTQQVPPVVGFTASAATTQLTGDGFKVKVTKQTVQQQNEDGIVLSESPGSGSTQKMGSTVAIVVGHYVRSTQTRTTTTTTTATTTTATTPFLNPITTTTSTGTTPTTTTSTGTTPTTTTSTSTSTTDTAATTPPTTTTTQ